MIKRSVFITFCLLVLYAAYIKYGKAKPRIQYLYQQNIARAQDYIYNDSIRKCDVILGTSLSELINQDSLPKGIYKLTFPGQSIFDGLSILKKSSTYPKYVFIEKNGVMKNEDHEFNSYLFNFINYYKNKYFPFMRDAYQPAGKLGVFFKIHCFKSLHFIAEYTYNPIARLFSAGRVKSANEDFFADEKRQKNTVDAALLKVIFTNLKSEITRLEKGGSKVCFYEVPSDKGFFDNKLTAAIRKNFLDYFPASSYIYLPNSISDGRFHTSDQLHLDSASAHRFSLELAKKINDVRQR